MKSNLTLNLYTVRTDWRVTKEADIPGNWARETFRIAAPNAEKAFAKAVQVSKSLEKGSGLGTTTHRLAEVIEGESIDGVAY